MPNWVKTIVKFEGSEEDIQKAIDSITATDKDGELGVDFNKIIPMPESLHVTSGSVTDWAISAYLSSINPNNTDVPGDKASNFVYENLLNQIGSQYRIMGTALKVELDESVSRCRDEIETLEDLISLGTIYVGNLIQYGCTDWYNWAISNWGTKWNASEPYIGDDYIEFQTAWSHPDPIMQKWTEMNPDVTFNVKFADEDMGVNCGGYTAKDGEVLDEYFPDIDENREDALSFASEVWYDDPDAWREWESEEDSDEEQGKEVE